VIRWPLRGKAREGCGAGIVDTDVRAGNNKIAAGRALCAINVPAMYFT
jgi:hypothetical protein